MTAITLPERTLTRPQGWQTNPSPEGTFGKWESPTGFSCFIGELPWRDDKPDISCIPAGRYLVKWLWSEHHQCNLYHIQDVPGEFQLDPERSNCEIHSGNLCGDVAEGYSTDVLGCQIPGASVAIFAANSIKAGKPARDQHGVTASGATLAALEKDLQDDEKQQLDFWLTIR
jgi:hypothetical protein